jgi:hypothetical protein
VDGAAAAAELERGHGNHDVAIRNILATLRQLLAVPAPIRRPIGFTADIDKPSEE